MAGKIIGIDAGNTRSGGGLTYLTEMLWAAAPERVGIDRVVVWGNHTTLTELPQRDWLKLIHEPAYDLPFYKGFWWQMHKLGDCARAEKCDLLFFPGSTYVGNFSPFVAVSQNMLPFIPVEQARFGWSSTRARLKLLRYAQASTFRRAAAVIFLTQWAKFGIEASVRRKYSRYAIIPHGISERFRRPTPVQRSLAGITDNAPFRWLYVSILAPYKHQWHVASAVTELRRRGFSVAVDFVGPAYAPSLARLQRRLRELDPEGRFLRYHGPVSYHELHSFYHRADGFVFATSCENLPNILIEAMSASLPIACSRAGPMPEVLGDCGLYFDPENVGEMVDVMQRLVRDDRLRARCASKAAARAHQYSWERTALQTFSFLGRVAEGE